MQTLIIVLLAVIAGSEVLRLVLTHKKTSRKAHFKQKLDGVQKMIWDLEFKVHKTRDIREEIRQEYDFMNSRLATLDGQIEAFPADGNIDEKKRIEDQKVLATRDRDRLQNQMKQLDLEVEGSKPTQEYPEGVTGINSQVESLRELTEMLSAWIKTL